MVPKYRLFTEDEMNSWLGIPVATLRTMRYRPGKDPIPYVKIGRLIRYREDMVLKWLERNTFNDSTEAKLYRKPA